VARQQIHSLQDIAAQLAARIEAMQTARPLVRSPSQRRTFRRGLNAVSGNGVRVEGGTSDHGTSQCRTRVLIQLIRASRDAMYH
jgi:hypothetical protein